MRFCWDWSWRSRIGTNFTSESRGNVWDFAEWLTLSKTVVLLSLCSSVQFWYRFSMFLCQSEANCCGYHGWSAHQVPMSTGQLYPPSTRVATVRCAPCPKLASCIFCTFGYLNAYFILFQSFCFFWLFDWNSMSWEAPNAAAFHFAVPYTFASSTEGSSTEAHWRQVRRTASTVFFYR